MHEESRGRYALGFEDVDQMQVAVVGGKGAHLAELARIEGICVPAGFCVTTDAFRRILGEVPSIDDRLERLARLEPDDPEAIRVLSSELRRALQGIAIPEDLSAVITHSLARLGEQAAYAVRSSATAEDLPSASFAGHYDSYLNVVGPGAVLEHVSRCWASLFSERAVTYRLRNGFDHRKVQMAVVVQQMVVPQAAGILFTADPVTSSRKVASVEASFGLGEALVSGLVNADIFKVRDGEVVARAVAPRQHAIHASPVSGTEELAVAPARQEQPALTDAQVVRLVQLGRRIEAHFGRPQDIEWCLAEGDFWIVQSRPITTLFPIPEAADRENHVYVSVGHGQMMTEAMRPLGVSVWQLTAMAPMHEAGGRLFVDVTQRLASPTTRVGLLEVMGRGDPLIGDALQTILERGDFLPSLPDEGPGLPPVGGAPAQIDTDPAIVTELIERNRVSIAALKRDIQTKSGPALFDFLLEAFNEHKRVLGDPLSHRAIMAGMQAKWWLNEQLEAWLGEKNAADTLTLSAPGNVTSDRRRHRHRPGKLALATRGASVLAVEPDPTMAALARQPTRGLQVEVQESTFEDCEVQAEAFDLVVSAQGVALDPPTPRRDPREAGARRQRLHAVDDSDLRLGDQLRPRARWLSLRGSHDGRAPRSRNEKGTQRPALSPRRGAVLRGMPEVRCIFVHSRVAVDSVRYSRKPDVRKRWGMAPPTSRQSSAPGRPPPVNFEASSSMSSDTVMPIGCRRASENRSDSS
jgi:hypothetical protein